MIKNIVVSTAAAAAAVLTIVACAQPGGEPVLNIDPQRHGNLAAAQRLVRDAFDRLTEAQKDNRYNLDGHAAGAKELLRQADDEIKLAAEAANRR